MIEKTQNSIKGNTMSNNEKMIKALLDIAEDRKAEIKIKISSPESLTIKSLMESLTKISGQIIRIDSIFMNSLISDSIDVIRLLSYQSVKSVLQQTAAGQNSLLGIALKSQEDISEEDIFEYQDIMINSGLKFLKEYYND